MKLPYECVLFFKKIQIFFVNKKILICKENKIYFYLKERMRFCKKGSNLFWKSKNNFRSVKEKSNMF